MATNPTIPLESDPNPNPTSAPSLYLDDMDELEHVFTRFDANSDDKISVDELHNVLRTLGSGVRPEELKRVMDDLDTDCDDFISLPELVAFCRSDMPDGSDAELHDAFDLYDRDKNVLILQGFQVCHSSIAFKIVCYAVNKAGLASSWDLLVRPIFRMEEHMKLDVLSNKVFVRPLMSSG